MTSRNPILPINDPEGHDGSNLSDQKQNEQPMNSPPSVNGVDSVASDDKTKDPAPLTEDITNSNNKSVPLEPPPVPLLEGLQDVYGEERGTHLLLEFDYKNRSIASQNLANRRLKAGQWSKQAILYSKLTEDRLQYIEEELRELQKRNDRKPIALEPPLPPDVGQKLKIELLSWTDFTRPRSWQDRYHSKYIDDFAGRMLNYVHVPEPDPVPKPIIEVGFWDPSLGVPGEYKEKAMDTIGEGELRIENPQERPSGVPNRIRIRSKHLIKDITSLCSAATPGPYGIRNLVILHPFKIMVIFKDQFQELLQDSEDRWSNLTCSAQSTATIKNNSKVESGEDHNDSVSLQQGVGENIVSSPAPCAGESNLPSGDEQEVYDILQHRRLFRELMVGVLKPIFELCTAIDNGTLKKIAFDNLWYLFQDCVEVRTPDENIQLYRIIKFTGGREVEVKPYSRHIYPDRDQEEIASAIYPQEGNILGAFVVECFYFDFDGMQYGPVQKTIIIRRYEGEKDVTTLPIYPLQFNKDPKGMREKLIARGNTFAQLTGSSTMGVHKQYTGMTIDARKEQVDSQIIVDSQFAFIKNPQWKPELGLKKLAAHDGREYTFLKSSSFKDCYNPGCCGNDIIMSDYLVDDMKRTRDIDEERRLLTTRHDAIDLSSDQKILFSNRVFGFVLRSRKWAAFNIDLVEKVKYNDGWSALVLPPNHKETVLALVKNHARDSEDKSTYQSRHNSMDLVRGKGKGLIILLHGEPGVGKTSTAECVADHTKRPLFPITCGDIGDNATLVEENLENNFQLAHRWGCVLLLDEADVFLQKRDKTDLTRNAIVSVFLRTLEYYSGILFLTTNRVGMVDQAFKSRIHLSLLYPRLDKDATLTIWKKHLTEARKTFQENGKPFDIDKKDIMAFAKKHYKELYKLDAGTWNGRQIHNSFQTAIALAEYEAGNSRTPSLTSTQFKKVADASKEFDLYMKNLHGGQNDADISQHEQSRLDAYTPNHYPFENPIPRRSRKPINVPKKKKKKYETETEESSEVSSDDDSESSSEVDDSEGSNLEEGSSGEGEVEDGSSAEETDEREQPKITSKKKADKKLVGKEKQDGKEVNEPVHDGSEKGSGASASRKSKRSGKGRKSVKEKDETEEETSENDMEDVKKKEKSTKSKKQKSTKK